MESTHGLSRRGAVLWNVREFDSRSLVGNQFPEEKVEEDRRYHTVLEGQLLNFVDNERSTERNSQSRHLAPCAILK